MTKMKTTEEVTEPAATVQNKSSGVIIGWKYDPPQYLGTGTELYNDLITAYDSGAKYIAIFDSNKDYTAGILSPEHLQAMQQFWQYTQNNTRKTPPVASRVAAILPNGYGCGFRSPSDYIWGLWCADSYTNTLYTNLGKLLQQYGNSLDIIYDDNLTGTYGYSQLINWTDPLLSTPPPPTPTPTPSPIPTLSPTPTASPTPTLPATQTPPPTPTPASSPSPTPTPSPSLTPVSTPPPTTQPTESLLPSVLPSPTEPLPNQTPSSKPAPFPSWVIYAATIVVAVVFITGGTFFFKKRK
jgi:hypothetical protein